MSRYSRHLRKTGTPQRVRADSAQRRNHAGGYTFVLDDFGRLERFLILGAEGGTYYASERKLVIENARVVDRCMAQDAARTVELIASVSESGRAPKNGPAIFALAMAAAFPEDSGRALALSAIPRVCRTGSHLFEFVEAVRTMRGWGRGLRRAVCRWYTTRDAEALAYQLLKYRQRSGYSHRDVLRLAGGAMGPHGEAHEALFRWVTTGAMDRSGFAARTVGLEGAEREYAAVSPEALPARVVAFEALQRETSTKRAAALIVEHGLSHEMVPNELLRSAEVWRALLERMPMTAMLRNLGRMTALGVLAPMNEGTRRVVSLLRDRSRLRKARVHPLAVLVALNTYKRGKGIRGSLSWKPVGRIVQALEDAFELAFGAIRPSEKRTLLALDVSGSMGWGQIAGMTGITPRIGSAAMAMTTMRSEPEWGVVGFSHELVPLAIHPRMSLEQVLQTVSATPMGGTDCAAPMRWALDRQMMIDTFVIYTDNETWFGAEHPHEALDRYRQRMGIAAKLIVVGMTATRFSIAKPTDAGMLDVVGFDSAAPNVMADFARG